MLALLLPLIGSIIYKEANKFAVFEMVSMVGCGCKYVCAQHEISMSQRSADACIQTKAVLDCCAKEKAQS